MQFFHIEKTGNSLHIWFGKLGVHIWKYKSKYEPWYKQFVSFETYKKKG